MASSNQQNNKAAHERHRDNDPYSPQNQGDNIQNMVEAVDNSRPLPHRLPAPVNKGSANRNMPFDPIRDIEPDQRRARGRQGFSSPPRNNPDITSAPPLRPASEYGRVSSSRMRSKPRTPADPPPGQSAYVSTSSSPRFSFEYESPRDAHNQPYAYHSSPLCHGMTSTYGSSAGFGHGQEGYTPAQSQPSASIGFTPPMQRPAHSCPGVYQYRRDNSEPQRSNPRSSAWSKTRPASSPTLGSGQARRQLPRSRPQSTEAARRTSRGTRRSETPEIRPSTPPPPPQPRRSRSRSPIRDPARGIRQRTEEDDDEWFRNYQRKIEEGHRPELGKRYGPKFKSCKRCERYHMKCVKAKGQEKCDGCFKANAHCVPKEEGKAEKKPNVKSRRPRPEDRPSRRRDDKDDDDHLGGSGRHYNLVGGGGGGPIVID